MNKLFILIIISIFTANIFASEDPVFTPYGAKLIYEDSLYDSSLFVHCNKKNSTNECISFSIVSKRFSNFTNDYTYYIHKKYSNSPNLSLKKITKDTKKNARKERREKSLLNLVRISFLTFFYCAEDLYWACPLIPVGLVVDIAKSPIVVSGAALNELTKRKGRIYSNAISGMFDPDQENVEIVLSSEDLRPIKDSI